MIDYKIEIQGEPIKKERPRFAHKDKNGNALPFVRTYNPQEDAEAAYRWKVIQYMMKNYGGVMDKIKGPVSIACIFHVKRPKSHYGTGKNAAILKKDAPYFVIKTPDLDNYEKFTYDCLNQVVWVDDKQVAESYSKKIYSEHPRTEIRIRSM